jgi:tRNA (guanine-N7-)-methyltransferase
MARQYFRSWASRTLYESPEDFPLLSSPALFGNQRPLELEVGCGTGEFLCALAGRDPEANYIGLDVALRPLYRAVWMAAGQKLHNILFLKADVRLVYPRLVLESLRAVYLHFPVPNLRRRHRKYRVLGPVFIDQVYAALEVGGRLSVMSDDGQYFEQAEEHLLGDKRFQPLDPHEYRVWIDEELKSPTQRIWEQRGLPIRRLVVRKGKERPAHG